MAPTAPPTTPTDRPDTALKVIDLTNNDLAGPIPACLLAAPVEELYVARNRLAGPLPGAGLAGSRLGVLAAGNQRRSGGGGLTGARPRAGAAAGLDACGPRGACRRACQQGQGRRHSHSMPLCQATCQDGRARV